jgi:MFS family permease
LFEYYDLFIAGLAASLAWPTLYFPESEPSIAFVGSLGAYAATNIARPVGGLAFGHLGDKAGRKLVLVWSLALTGGGIFATALLPDYKSIGIVAPALLILFRIITGIGLGAEWGSAATIVSEFAARSRWRAFWTSWIQNMSIIGSTLSAFAFTVARAYLTQTEFLNYGWRYIFLVGVLGLAVAGFVRYGVGESPVFQEAQRRRALAKSPTGLLLREHWKTVLILMLAVVPPIQFTSFILSPYAVAYLSALKVNALTITSMITLSGLVALAVGIITGIIAGFTRRKRIILIIMSALQLILIFPFFILLKEGAEVGSVTLMLGMITLFQCIRTSGQAVVPAVLTEQFELRDRATGSGFAYQMSTFLAGGLILFFVMDPLQKMHGTVGVASYFAAIWIILCALAVILPALFIRDKTELSA